MSFVADGQAAVVEQPGVGPFDLPSPASEAFAALDATSGDVREDAPAGQEAAQVRVVIGFVGVEFGRSPAAWSTAGTHRRDAQDQRLEHETVMGLASETPRARGIPLASDST